MLRFSFRSQNVAKNWNTSSCKWKLIWEGIRWFGNLRVCGKLPIPDGTNYVSLYSVMNTSNT